MPFRLLFFAALAAFLLSIQGVAQTNNLENDTSLTADILITTLYAKTAAEKEYCEKIIQLRDAKILPNRILFGVYRQTTSREKDRRFTYFQTALEILCKREGIDLSQSVPVKSTNFFRFTPTKPTVSTSTTVKPNPLAFFNNLFRR